MVMPKLTVSDYSEMLRKLSTAFFFVTLGCVSLLRWRIPAINEALANLDFATPTITSLFSISIPLGTILLAFGGALLSESMKLHDKISDLFWIRREFDIRWILIPMALLSEAKVNSGKFEKIKSERKRLMGDVFYAYASSSAGKPVIDPHTIKQALTTWSWYWLCVEAIVALLITAAILAYAGDFLWATTGLGAILFLMLLMRFFWADCAKYADSQVQQILKTPARRRQIDRTFNAL